MFLGVYMLKSYTVIFPVSSKKRDNEGETLKTVSKFLSITGLILSSPFLRQGTFPFQFLYVVPVVLDPFGWKVLEVTVKSGLG